MRWPEPPAPVRMRRVALVAPAGSLRDVLVAVAATGVVEIDHGAAAAVVGEAARRLQQAGRPVTEPALLAGRPSLSWLESAGRYDLLAGEAQLEGYAAVAIRRSGAAALAGWIAADRLPEVAVRVTGAGGALVPLRRPRGVEPPTLLPGQGVRRSISPLVQT